LPELSAARALAAPLAQQLAVYSAFAVTIGIALGGPRIGRLRVPGHGLTAAMAVAVLWAAGILDASDLLRTGSILWRAIVTIASIMVLSAAAQRLGVLDWLADLTERGVGRSAIALYARIYLLAMASAAVLNNDTTILLMTPLVIGLVRRRYPGRPDLVLPFVFAVFMAAGVAPFMVSNPMNMVVASAVGIGFNDYALAMVPVAVVSWLVSFLMLCILFAGQLAGAPDPARRARRRERPTGGQVQILALLLLVLSAYPLVAAVDGPVWLVALLGASTAAYLLWRQQGISPGPLLREGVAWETLAFLVGVFLLGVAMEHVGVVGRLARLYDGAGVFEIGGIAAVASSFMNNHPTAILNALALGGEHADKLDILAALVGGDLGPRLLPTGSLAGLLWISLLRVHGVPITTLQFARVGVVVMVPSLLAALAVLHMP